MIEAAFGFVLGVIVQTLIKFPLALIFLFVLISAALFSIYFIRRKLAKNAIATATVAFFCLGVSLGMLRTSMNLQGELPLLVEHEGKEVFLSGFIRDEPAEKDSYTSFVLNGKALLFGTSTELIDARILVKASYSGDIGYGDGVIVKGQLQNITEKYKDIPSYAHFLQKDNILYEINYAKVEKTSLWRGNRLIQSLLIFKSWFNENIKARLPEPHASIATGMVIAGKGALPKETQTLFTEAGIIHIVVLSGYNIAIIGTLLLILFKNFGRKVRAASVTLVITLFVLMAGASAPVLRSSLMALAALVGKLNYRTASGTRLLCFVGFLMVLWNPLTLLYDPSFQLSFLATFAVIEVAPRIKKYFFFVTEKMDFREILSQTIGVQLFLAPYLLYKMGGFSLAGFFVNLLVLPLVPFIMFFSFLVGITGSLGAIASPFALITSPLISWMLVVSKIFTSLPFSTLSISKLTIFIPLLFYGAMLSWLIFNNVEKK